MSTGFVLNIPQEMLNRLEDADKKIEKLARTSEDAQVRIVSAFKSMTTNGVDAFIQRLDVAQQKLAQLGGTQLNMGVNANTSGFQQLIDAINNLSKASKTDITINGLGTIGNQTQTAIDAINRLMATLQQLQQMGGQQFLGGVNTLGRQTLREMNKEAKKMQKTMQDLDDAIQKYGISATDLANKLQQARQAQQQFNDAAKQQAQADVSGLIGMKGQQTTLNELKNYASELKRTMANLDPKSQEWKKLNEIYKQTNREIKNIENSMKGVQKQSRSLMDISGQLARKLALVFSVSQITGYVKKLIEVRGEFELQQRSLQAILQNKDEANRIWQQTVDLAVRSPFRVKELVSYTKQLAAYRIESDRLFETNKMLADISAGLGVDMQRLILAFGQVRSAAYLRGTELRQFTEAGIPILEQLAQYFTELEGRAVSVGDVFERISKRMVSFADVEEIFRRMTSEGGSFYRMQEIQAETLKGMWSNLKDSVDLMLNEIGKANEGTLKGSIQSIKELVDGWRDLAFALKMVLVPLGTYLSITAAIRFANTSFSQGLLMMAMNIKTTSNLLVNAEKRIISFATKIGLGQTAAAGFAKALGGLASLGVAGIIAGIVVGFIALITKLTSASRAAKQLKKDLQAIYNEDTSSLKTQVRGFEALVGRLKDINRGSREHEEIISQLNSQYGEYIGFIVDEKTTYDQLASSIDSVTLALTRKAKMNTFEKAYSKTLESTNKQISELEDRITKQAFKEGMTTDEGKTPLMPTQEQIEDIFGLIEKKVRETGKKITSYDQLNEIVSEYYGKDVEVAGTAIKNFTDITDYYLQQKEAELELDRKINDVYGEGLRSSLEARQAFADLEERQAKALKAVEKEPKWVKEAVRNQFAKEKIDLEIKYEGLDEATAELRKKALDSMSATIKDVNKKIEDSVPKLGEKYANIIYIDENEASKGVNQIAESTAEAYKAQKEIIKQQTSLKEAGTAYDKEILDNAQKTADAYYYKLQLLGRLDLLQKETTKEETKEMKLLRQQLAALKESGQTYQSLRKDFDKTTAIQKTASAFKDLFAELGMSDITKDMSFDELGILKVLEELPNRAGDAGKKAIEKLRAEFLGERDVEAQRKISKRLLDTIQEQFDRYDLTLELKQLNIPPDLAKSLFDVDYLDLEGLKKAVQDQGAKFVGTDMEKEYEDFLKKINDLSRKAQEDEAKEFINFLKKSLDEVKLIQDKGAYNIALADRLFGEGKITVEQYMSSIRQIVGDTNKEVSRVNLELFKDSPKYIQAMGDLTAYSTKEIRELIKSLEDVVAANSDAFSADEAKAYIDAIYNAQEKLDELERSPFRWETFANIGDILKTDKEINAQKEERDRLQEQEKTQLEELIRLEERLKQLQEEKNAILSGEGDFKSKANRLALNQYEIDVTTSAIQQGQKAVAATQSQAKTTETILGKLGDKMKGLVGKGGSAAQAIAIIDAIINGINDTVQGILDITNEVGSVLESYGKETDMSTDFGQFQKGFAIFAESSQHAADGWNALKNGDPVGAVVSIVKSVTSLIRGINEYKDAEFQVEIDKQAKEIEKLGKAYEKLEKATEGAYSIEQLQQYNKELENNIQLQIAAYNAMITAERDKKNTDDEQIDAWNDELEALTQQWEELKQSLVEGVGGVSDYRSQTREFVDSWVSAFKETGNGLSGLKENFRDFFDNIIAEQAALRVTEKFLAPFYESVNTALGDLELTVQESKNLREEADKIMPELSNALELIWNQLGGSRGDSSGGSLSALQKGIQGITESTAQVLEAIANSSRGYLANIDSKMDSILANIGAGAEENPMLEQIKAQTGYLREIRDVLSWATTSEARALYVRLTQDSRPR